MESIRLSTTLIADPEDVYDAWISGKRHAEMTGSAATSEKRKGGSFTAWGGYISGKHLELGPGTRILQTWRTTEFPSNAPDSRLEVRLSKVPRGTQITLLQSGIPDGQGEMYTEGWQDHYFDPMNEYFRKGASKRLPAKKAKAAPKAKAAKSAKAREPAKPAKKKGTRRKAKPR
jgi:activator of HSP90 ATPase